MSFMKPQIYRGDYFEVDTSTGTEIVPADIVGGGRTASIAVEALLNYLEGTPDDADGLIEIKRGWLARMSAPGYMDCTEWMAFETQWEALVYLVDHYMDDTHCVLDIPSHFLSALVNGDTTGLSDEDDKALDLFVHQNPEASGVESTSEDHHFDGYQDVTECICRLTEYA